MVPLPFEACSTFTIAGATKSGKTTFVFRLLKNKDVMFSSPVEKVLYCYGAEQELFNEMKNQIPNITFHKGLPDNLESFSRGYNHCAIVLDNLMDSVVKDVEMQRLFTQGAHHLKLSVLFLTHNCFQQGKCARTIALNTHYLILFRNMRDGQQIVSLGKQLFPGNGMALVESYKDATKQAYGYLVLDLTAHGDNTYRMRSRIFPGEDPWVYIPKNL